MSTEWHNLWECYVEGCAAHKKYYHSHTSKEIDANRAYRFKKYKEEDREALVVAIFICIVFLLILL